MKKMLLWVKNCLVYFLGRVSFLIKWQAYTEHLYLLLLAFVTFLNENIFLYSRKTLTLSSIIRPGNFIWSWWRSGLRERKIDMIEVFSTYVQMISEGVLFKAVLLLIQIVSDHYQNFVTDMHFFDKSRNWHCSIFLGFKYGDIQQG